MEDTSKYLSLGTITQSDAVQRTIETTISRGSEGTSSPKKNTGWNKTEGLGRLAVISKDNNTWIHDSIYSTIIAMEKEQKPDWITDEQWKIKPLVAWWEDSKKQGESIAQSKPVSVEEARAQFIRLRSEKNWKEGK
jgi:hypothetical protein